MYNEIVSKGPVPMVKGKKGMAYDIPLSCWDGPPGNQGQIRILVAFICEKWTWVFVDHNAMLTVHVMALRTPLKEADLEVSSEVRFSFTYYPLTR